MNQTTNPALKWVAEGRTCTTTRVSILGSSSTNAMTHDDKNKKNKKNSSSLRHNNGHPIWHWINHGHMAHFDPSNTLIKQNKINPIKGNMVSASFLRFNALLPHYCILWFLKEIQWKNRFKIWMSPNQKLTNAIDWLTEKKNNWK